jgi:hypothetical protein
MSWFRRLATAVAVVAWLALPPTAGASRVSVDTSGPSIFPGPNNVDFLVDTVFFRYDADPGEGNALNAVRTPGGWTFTDPGATIQAPPCTVSSDGHAAFCPRPPTHNRLRELLLVNAGDGNDTVGVDWPAAQDPSLVSSGALLFGGDGDDTVTGGELADDLRGGAGDDRLDGSAGNDEVSGDAGRDRLAGGADDDVLESRDGEQDVDDCGAGTDRVLADASDTVTGCEIDGATPATGATAPGPPAAVADRTAPVATLGLPNRPRRIATLVRRGLLVSVRSSEASTVRAELRRGGSRGRAVARAARRLRASGKLRIRLRLTASARRQLSALRRTRLALRVTITDLVGNRRTLTRTLGFRR